jgi:hypothetical protein
VRVQWTLSLRPTDDLNVAKSALVNRHLADARVLKEPAPRAFVREWADDKRVLAVQAWTDVGHYQEMPEALGRTLDASMMYVHGRLLKPVVAFAGVGWLLGFRTVTFQCLPFVPRVPSSTSTYQSEEWP